MKNIPNFIKTAAKTAVRAAVKSTVKDCLKDAKSLLWGPRDALDETEAALRAILASGTGIQ